MIRPSMNDSILGTHNIRLVFIHMDTQNSQSPGVFLPRNSKTMLIQYMELVLLEGVIGLLRYFERYHETKRVNV